MKGTALPALCCLLLSIFSAVAEGPLVITDARVVNVTDGTAALPGHHSLSGEQPSLQQLQLALLHS